MIHEIRLCDLCNAPITFEEDRQLYGVSIQTRHSVNGWGNAQEDAVFSGEVCTLCWREYKQFVAAVKMWKQKRKGIRMPEIIVRERDITVRTDTPAGEPKQLKAAT